MKNDPRALLKWAANQCDGTAAAAPEKSLLPIHKLLGLTPDITLDSMTSFSGIILFKGISYAQFSEEF